MKNPFQYTGLVDNEYYLSRTGIEKELQLQFESRQNLLVQGPRRMGKSSAIIHTFSKLQKARKCYFVHTDFYGIETLNGVRDKLFMAMEQLPLSVQLRKQLEKAGPLTGASAFGFGLSWTGQQRENLLEDALNLFAKIGKSHPLVVFFDEFQSLLEAKESSEILGRLRSEIQKQPDVFYLYAGSDRIRLRDIFFLERSPFFKSAALLEVGSIDRKDFIPWLEKRFAQGKRTIDPTIWPPLFDLMQDVPGDIQHFCHALWDSSKPGDPIADSTCEKATVYLLDMQEKSFIDFWNMLSGNQQKFLRGLALRPGLGHSSNAFLEQAGLSSSSAASKALNAMLSRGALWKAGSSIAFSNPFLKLWILRNESRV